MHACMHEYSHTHCSQTHARVSCANNALTVLCRQDLLHWLDSVSKLIKAPYKIEKVWLLLLFYHVSSCAVNVLVSSCAVNVLISSCAVNVLISSCFSPEISMYQTPLASLMISFSFRACINEHLPAALSSSTCIIIPITEQSRMRGIFLVVSEFSKSQTNLAPLWLIAVCFSSICTWRKPFWAKPSWTSVPCVWRSFPLFHVWVL